MKPIFTIKIFNDGNWKCNPPLDKYTQNILGHHFSDKVILIAEYLKIKKTYKKEII